MSSSTVSVKRHNHRVHPCEPERKAELLEFLITRNAGLSILIVTANDPEILQASVKDEHVVVMSDTALTDAPELRCDLLISYDLPEKAIVYMARLARTKTYALILLDPKEQKQLYPIETLLGRNIMQEVLGGFEPRSDTPLVKEDRKVKERQPKQKYKPSREDKRDDRKYDEKTTREDKRPPHKSVSKEKTASDKRSKQKREPSRYIGKDENGKPIFSGKTGERNHRYDGTPKESREKAAYKGSGKKPEFSENGEKKRTGKPNSFDARSSEQSKEKKPWEKAKAAGSKKPYTSSEGKKKPFKSASSSRPPRVFKKSLKQQKESK